jgi:hypothetical protein
VIIDGLHLFLTTMKKRISFRLFKIDNSDKSIKAPQLRKALSERLRTANEIGKRMMSLKGDNPDSDTDVLSSFANAEESKYFYGVIMRCKRPIFTSCIASI